MTPIDRERIYTFRERVLLYTSVRRRRRLLFSLGENVRGVFTNIELFCVRFVWKNQM